LTRRDVPPELQDVILGTPDGLSITPSALIATIPSALFEASVAVYCGRPGELWSIGTHHAGETLWGPVVRELCFRPEHPQFATAFSELAFRGDGATLAEAIGSVRVDLLDQYFELLLKRRTYEAGNYLSEAWQALFSRANEDTKERWLNRIVGVASLALDHLRDVKAWLKGSPEEDALFRKLEADVLPLRFVLAIRDLRPEHREAFKEAAAASLKAWIAKFPPLIFGTYDDIRRQCEALGIQDTELEEMLETGRMRVLDIRERVELEHHELPGWLEP
jgi:hypothetical protein